MPVLHETVPERYADDSLVSEAMRLFQDGQLVRPTPQRMAGLVLHGLTEDHLMDGWQELGYAVPVMGLTLEEVDNTLPYVGVVSDALAAKNNNVGLRLFAGRDGEALYDDFAIVHADQASSLIPASTPLWSRGWLRRRATMRTFLEQHGVTDALLQDDSQTIEIADTGFQGSIGRHIRKAVRRCFEYGSDAQERMSTHLVHANPESWGTTITPIEDFKRRDTLPKMYSWMGDERFAFYEKNAVPSLALAVSLQLHPRYHGTYVKLATEADGTVLALPDDDEVVSESTDQYWNERRGGNCNDSIVNPLAAAIIQRKIVAAALQRAQS